MQNNKEKMSEYIIINTVDWSALEKEVDKNCPNELKFHLCTIIFRIKDFLKNEYVRMNKIAIFISYAQLKVY